MGDFAHVFIFMHGMIRRVADRGEYLTPPLHTPPGVAFCSRKCLRSWGFAHKHAKMRLTTCSCMIGMEWEGRRVCLGHGREAGAWGWAFMGAARSGWQLGGDGAPAQPPCTETNPFECDKNINVKDPWKSKRLGMCGCLVVACYLSTTHQMGHTALQDVHMSLL